VWHCTNYRLEPSVGDPVESVSGISRFKMPVGMLYVLYNASPKITLSWSFTSQQKKTAMVIVQVMQKHFTELRKKSI
jgi:hypothetical protein